MAGGIVAITASLVVFILLPITSDGYEADIQHLYDQYITVADTRLTMQPPTRSLGAGEPTAASVASAANFFITRGIIDGMMRLDQNWQDSRELNVKSSVSTPPSTQDLPQRDQELLVYLGRLTLLTQLKCQQQQTETDFVNQSLTLHKELLEQLTVQNYLSPQPLQTLQAQDIEPDKKLCLCADWLYTLTSDHLDF